MEGYLLSHDAVPEHHYGSWGKIPWPSVDERIARVRELSASGPIADTWTPIEMQWDPPDVPVLDFGPTAVATHGFMVLPDDLACEILDYFDEAGERLSLCGGSQGRSLYRPLKHVGFDSDASTFRRPSRFPRTVSRVVLIDPPEVACLRCVQGFGMVWFDSGANGPTGLRRLVADQELTGIGFNHFWSDVEPVDARLGFGEGRWV